MAAKIKVFLQPKQVLKYRSPICDKGIAIIVTNLFF
jgi:hypothetical protein